MSNVVPIIMPNGLPGTIPAVDLEQALAAGAKLDSSAQPSQDGGGLLGAGAAAVLGAGSAATGGYTDRLLAQGPYVLGGPSFAHEATSNFRRVREANPGSTIAGELGGLLLNPEAITGLGEAAAAPVAARVGEGLLGSAATSAARVAVESAAMGAQHQLTEDMLGDHGYNAEAIFASAAKDALLGAAAGGALGAAGYGLFGKSAGALASKRGPIGHAALDEIAGVDGAGPGLRDQASRAEAAIEGLRRTGATVEQATKLVDDIETAAKARVSAGPGTGLVDDAIDRYAGWIGEASPERAALVRQHYADSAKPIADAASELDRAALDMRKHGTSVLRNIRDTADLEQFANKSDRFSKLVDPAFADAQRDQVASLLQDTDKTLKFWEGTVAKGGAEGDLRKLRALHTDAMDALAGAKRRIGFDVPAVDAEAALDTSSKLEKAFKVRRELGIDADAGLHAPEGPVNDSTIFPTATGKMRLAGDAFKVPTSKLRATGAPARLRTTFELAPDAEGIAASRAKPIKIDAVHAPDGAALHSTADRFKRALDKYARWGRAPGVLGPGATDAVRFGLPEATNDLAQLANGWRSSLEDESVWGRAGAAQRRENAAFSEMKARADHFMDQLGVAIDQQRGVSIPEIDFAKTRSMLDKITGNPEVDEALQPVISVRRTIEGYRDRVNALRTSGEVASEADARLSHGLKDLDAFETTFNAAMKRAAVSNRLKSATLEEKGSGLGGLLGVAGDIVTRPLKTVERFAQIRNTVSRVEDAIRSGLRKYFGVTPTDRGVVGNAVAPRARKEIIAEMEDIRSTVGSPAALEAHAARLVGDLGKFAPQTANELRLTAQRALIYLAREAPPASTTWSPLGGKTAARYSEIQLHDWETKRHAALDPQSVINDMRHGVLNRDAIQATEFVAPKLFGAMQDMARAELARMDARGELDRMPYQQKAVIATLLKVPADVTWTTDFIRMMQSAMVRPDPSPQPGKPPALARKTNTRTADAFQTASQTIEAGGVAA